MPHKSVLLKEAVDGLNLRSGMTVVDGTLGSAGHALEIVKKIQPNGKLIAIDQDPAAIERGKEKLKEYSQVFFQASNFRFLRNVLHSLNIPEVDAVIIDVGFSSDQLEDSERGFSYERHGPLDMRMNPELKISARDLINDLSQQELEKIFWEYGEERLGRRFAAAICEARISQSIETTTDLVQILANALVPGHKKKKANPRPGWARKHPATKVFQALRIAVNDELNVLTDALPEMWASLRKGGRVAVIAFHSLEDRIVKHQFRRWSDQGLAKLITKKPIVPSEAEIHENPRARSAKLRIAEKIA